jgi:hypothetical protein
MPTDGTRFGYTTDAWHQAVQAGVQVLIGVARDQGTISYTDLCNKIYDICGIEVVPGEYALPHVLGDISEETLASDDIAITTLVTYASTTEAGQGLYALAVQKGPLPRNPTEAQKDAFRIDHMNRARERWPRPPRRRPGERFQTDS